MKSLIFIANTFNKSRKARVLGEEKKYFNDEEIKYYVERLAKMIQCRTVSVKGSFTKDEFYKLREVMKELFPEIHKKAEIKIFSDDCWIYKIEGKDKEHNIMLMSHHDVVPADGEWKYPPFEARIAEGKIWGRGTVDTKTPLFAEFSAIEELLEEGYEFPCNVYIGSSHNEELGGDGIPTANEYFKKNNITFDVILDEGGALIEPPLAGMKCDKCAMVAVHEKGRIYLECTAKAAEGHASLTAASTMTPVERMAAFINEIQSKNIFIRNMNKEVTAMFDALAPYCPVPLKFILSNLWFFSPILKRLLPKINAQAGGLIGTTCTFNKINGSAADKKCTATAFLRPVNEEDMLKDIEAFKEAAKKYDITVEQTAESEYHGPADMTKPQYAYTMKCIEEVFPQYPASPFILPAGTDARTFTDICPCVLRFAPIKLSAQQLSSVHSPNENLDCESAANCVKFYKYFLENYRV